MNGIVIIGGSVEAYRLARQLPGATVLLSAPERVARRWPGPVRVGPIDAAALRLAGARAVVEAAHPCDTATAHATAKAAQEAAVPHLQLVRPAWRAGRRDLWLPLQHVREAAAVIPRGARVLVTTGREALPGLKALQAHVLMRRIGGETGPFPLKRGRFLGGSGPFTVQHEIRLMRRERVDWLLVHNAGGTGGWPKLQAARQLHLPVAMLARPRRPDGPRVETVTEALRWLEIRTQ
ncbi:precorrin-6A/cobalt-precorrin-6A reductase [Antarctobacter jejuensis]|uniref:precorrin-6A/cobalt-precorrin-6A reductase n=1 Tax=Antarctobacter jejuensis TaxID=1439938 RepID=UPI003FCF31D0